MKRRRGMRLLLPAADLGALKDRVRALAENRPGVYRMIDSTGNVVYVGKTKHVRTRLLSYFRARHPDKQARILNAAADIAWEYAPSEFAALLGELRLIRRLRPHFNWSLNRTRRSVLVKVSQGAAARVYVGGDVAKDDQRAYGPFRSMSRTVEAVRTLNDLLGLRDCAAKMPIVYAGQRDLFDQPLQAACARHAFGSCSGPCAGFVAEWDYRRRVETAMAFLEGRTIQPIDRVVRAMQEAAENAQFELAARWREKFEQVEWLLAATARARTAVDLLSFVYRDPGEFGDDRVYLVRQGLVKATFPYPSTPIEHEAFRAVVRDELEQPGHAPGWLPLDGIDEILLVMSWFRRHPEALRRTTPFEHWTR